MILECMDSAPPSAQCSVGMLFVVKEEVLDLVLSTWPLSSNRDSLLLTGCIKQSGIKDKQRHFIVRNCIKDVLACISECT